MNLSKNGYLWLASNEGLCLRPYFDSVGVITVGIGSTVTEIPNLKNWNRAEYPPLQELIDIYKNSMDRYETAVNDSINVGISQEEFDACVSLCYIGTGGFKGSTLVRRINSKATSDLIYAAFMMWDKPSAIIERRRNEAHLFCSGIYPSFQVTQTDTDGNGKELIHQGKIVDLNPYF